MKTNKINIKLATLSIILFTTSFCHAQFFPTGGYQGGLYGSGGDETFQLFLPEPRGLSAIGGDEEVYLKWDMPFPIGEITYDDGTAEAWYFLSNPSSSNDMFYVRFEAPISGKITDIAVLSGADSEAYWEEILICPDDGTGKPDIGGAWESFPSVPVKTSPVEGGEWEILNLNLPQTIANRDTFYIVTRWTDGSNAEPFLATDTDSNSGRSAWTMDDGLNWGAWPENFIMRAYITDENNKGVVLKSEEKTISAYTPVVSIANGEIIHYKSTSLASSIEVPKISVVGNYEFKSLTSYSIYRSETQGGTYDYLDSETGLSFVDNTVVNNTEYYYVIAANYNGENSTYSNEAMAYPQQAAVVPYTNNFDVDNGNFYGREDWEWGTPSYVNGPVANSSPNVWGTVLNGDYNNSSFSWLILPFNLNDPGVHALSFANWFDIESGVDFGYLAIDHDNDGIFYVLDTYTGNSGGWITESLIIHDSLSSPYCKLAFVLESDNANTEAGFYVDDFVLDRYIDLELKVFLEGPFNGVDMNTDLISIEPFNPFNQPYNAPPWNYPGTESITSIPNTDIVDWVLVELRDTTLAGLATPESMIARQAAFMLKDGSIVGMDGISNLRFDVAINYQLFTVIHHRNHLAIMSANPLTETAGFYTYDFSSGENQVYNGTSGHKDLGGLWGMYAGDGNKDGYINASDKNVWSTEAGTFGYFTFDYDLDAQVDNPDKNDVWLNNQTKESQVPQ